MSSLPKSVIDKGTELATGASLFGIPVVELSREELIAAVGYIKRHYESRLEMEKFEVRVSKMVREVSGT